jgi:hypothetical protein
MYCNLGALYFCTGSVCITKATLLKQLGVRVKKRIAKSGFTLGQLGAALQTAKTPYRVSEAPQLKGNLLGLITQQEHQVVSRVCCCVFVCVCITRTHPHPAGHLRHPGDLPQEARVPLLRVLPLQGYVRMFL